MNPFVFLKNTATSYLIQTNPMLDGSAQLVQLVRGALSNLVDNEPPPFPFLELPRELRDYVYTLVLFQAKQPLHLSRRPKSDNEPKKDATAILATSRRVYLEARRIFLSRNAFVIRANSADYKWLTSLGREGQRRLQKVFLVIDFQFHPHPSNHRIINILSRCPRLSLTIKVHCRQLVALYKIGAFKYLHGVSRVTVQKSMSGTNRGCELNHYGSHPRLLPSNYELEPAHVDTLLEKLGSACPKGCIMHQGRNAADYVATVHVDCDYGCFFCYSIETHKCYRQLGETAGGQC